MPYFTAAAAVLGVIVSGIALVLSSRSQKRTHEATKAAQKVDERAKEFDILKGTVDTLNGEVTRLKDDNGKIRVELRSCRRNERLLRDFVQSIHPGADLPEVDDGE